MHRRGLFTDEGLFGHLGWHAQLMELGARKGAPHLRITVERLPEGIVLEAGRVRWLVVERHPLPQNAAFQSDAAGTAGGSGLLARKVVLEGAAGVAGAAGAAGGTEAYEVEVEIWLKLTAVSLDQV